MKPWLHQIEDSEKAYKILKENAIVYLACEERTGKSLTALLIAEKALVIKVLIVTKKGKPKEGWDELLQEFKHNKVYHVTTYHQLTKLKDMDWDLVILDESHNYIAAFPDHSKLWSVVKRYTTDKPIIYISATPNAQSLGQLYGQFALSSWSPFHNYPTYKKWHAKYGNPYVKHLRGRKIDMWDDVKDELVKAKTNHLFITRTRQDLDFVHEPEDKLHWIELTDTTKAIYNQILKKKVYTAEDGKIIEYDTKTKLRFGLHMLEGGTLKRSFPALNKKGNPVMSSVTYDTGNTEKIDYIKEQWGDNNKVAIMYNYIREGQKLREHFEHAEILQATTNAEGISLMHIDHLIIYSQDFSTARHTQRRARQANKARDSEIVVHFLLVEKGISEEVYNTVSLNKTNYVDMYFTGSKL